MSKPWWRKHLIRCYHPQIGEAELRDLDVSRFVAACRATHADTIIVRAGGPYALYPSQVPYHRVGPTLEGRDLFGEILAQAHAAGLRVIADLDFSHAGEEVWREHPDWFQRRADGEVVSIGDCYVTCPSGGYRKERFAYLVLREVLTRYAVDGVHVSQSGFGGLCYCLQCTAAFGEPLPRDPQHDAQAWHRFMRWREMAICEYLSGYAEIVRRLNPQAFFTAELAGPESPERTVSAAHHLPALSHVFSQLLVATGYVSYARRSRWWTSLAADQARAARRSKRNPVLGIHMQMPDLHLPEALLPPGEFAFYCYQSLAHGAGLKVSTSSAPEWQPDPRAMPTLAEVFGFMQGQQEVLDSMEPIAHVALVWPEAAIRRNLGRNERAAEGLRKEALGLYSGLTARHVLFKLLYDEHISPLRLKRYRTVVLPTAVWLEDEQANALATYVQRGGHLVLLDGDLPEEGGEFLPLPAVLADLLGGDWTREAIQARYALPVAAPEPDDIPTRVLSRQCFCPLPSTLSTLIGARRAPGAAPCGIGPLPLTRPCRRVRPDERAQVWLRGSIVGHDVASDNRRAAEVGQDPILVVKTVGEGMVVYWASGLGQMILDMGHSDYTSLLEAMVSHGALSLPYLLTDAPSSVAVTLAHWQSGVVIHLVNGAGPAPLDAPAPVGPITLDLAWDGPALAKLCAPGVAARDLACQDAWNRVKIVVPKLGAYAQVVVRSA